MMVFEFFFYIYEDGFMYLEGFVWSELSCWVWRGNQEKFVFWMDIFG